MANKSFLMKKLLLLLLLFFGVIFFTFADKAYYVLEYPEDLGFTGWYVFVADDDDLFVFSFYGKNGKPSSLSEIYGVYRRENGKWVANGRRLYEITFVGEEDKIMIINFVYSDPKEQRLPQVSRNQVISKFSLPSYPYQVLNTYEDGVTGMPKVFTLGDLWRSMIE
jgi:hypothetical protein